MARTFFQRLTDNDDNHKIVVKLSAQVEAHFLTTLGSLDDVFPCDVRDLLAEWLSGSKLLKSLLPQQRKPFLKGLAEYCYNSIHPEQ